MARMRIYTHPDLLLVPTTTTAVARDGQPHINPTTALPTRKRSILDLRIHAHRLSAHAEARRDVRVGVERRVCTLDRLEERELVQC